MKKEWVCCGYAKETQEPAEKVFLLDKFGQKCDAQFQVKSDDFQYYDF